MRDITTFILESHDDYEKKCTEHIINVLKDHNVDFEHDFDKKDSAFNYWIRLKSTIKENELQDINKELCKVLANHEVSVGKKLIVNIFKEPQLTIDPQNQCIYLYGAIKSYYEKNIEK